MLKENVGATRRKLKGWLEKAVKSLKGEKGATAVEYALIVGLIAVGIIAAVTALRTELVDLFTRITEALAGIGIPG